MKTLTLGEQAQLLHMRQSFQTSVLAVLLENHFLEEDQNRKRFLLGKEKKWTGALGAVKVWANSLLWVGAEDTTMNNHYPLTTPFNGLRRLSGPVFA